ncbi:hypothetical protein [uncultured Microbulbifer sp.]|uniref:hypothetical protein n=1 Tax=uncultured Microbulbifer sp. TaxID=348147 RepID=UPI00260F486A|nr:hypothetical protein [uncultured Microbulbifer sp.]
MTTRVNGAERASVLGVSAGLSPAERRGLPLSDRERLEEADKLVALMQFALSGRDQAELNSEVQAGCVLVLDQIREAVQRVANRH